MDIIHFDYYLKELTFREDHIYFLKSALNPGQNLILFGGVALTAYLNTLTNMGFDMDRIMQDIYERVTYKLIINYYLYGMVIKLTLN
jgi:hypothetical protein